MKSFKDIPVSTQTYIVQSNIQKINLTMLSNLIELSDQILSMRYKAKSKGCAAPVSKNFLNCVTLTVQLDKKINIKVFNNGVFQLTGCKKYDHARDCMLVVWEEFERVRFRQEEVGEKSRVYGTKLESCFTLKKEPGTPTPAPCVMYIISAMRNVDFELGYKVDREALGVYIQEQTEYKVPPMTKGYMGVKIKIPLENVDELLIHKIMVPRLTKEQVEFEKRKSPKRRSPAPGATGSTEKKGSRSKVVDVDEVEKRCSLHEHLEVVQLEKTIKGLLLKEKSQANEPPVEYTKFRSITTESVVLYKDFLTNIHPNLKKLTKQRFVSISVFQNGKVLMSGIDLEYQIPYYDWFMKLVEKIEDKIKVVVEPEYSFRGML
jgi:hypothetical protein